MSTGKQWRGTVPGEGLGNQGNSCRALGLWASSDTSLKTPAPRHCQMCQG